MAISVAWQTVVTVATSNGALYTVPSSTAASFAYARDLVLTNSGATTIFVNATGAGSPVATTTGSYQVPSGGTLLLTQCQVPNGAVVSALSPGTAGSLSIGYATNVAYI